MAQATPADVSVAEDPSITQGVFSNPLDNYELPQFVCHLYMAQNNDPESQSKFTIAKTGVTATQIDNIIIKTYANGVAAGELTFVLTQPGHVTLIDEMLSAREVLGLPTTTRPILFLDINFIGYSTDLDNNEIGGEIQHIAGPYRYKLLINKIAISVTSEGSSYDVSTTIHNYYAYKDFNYTVPYQIVLVGSTIRATLAEFKKAIEWYYAKTQLSYTYRDVFTFDLDDPSLAPFVDQALVADDSKSTPLGGDSESPQYHEENIDVKGTTLVIKEGASFYAVIRSLFSLVPEFRKEVTKRTKQDDPSSTEVDLNKTFVKWFRVNTDVKELKFDPKRNEYAREFIFTPVVYDTASTEIDIPEANDMREPKNWPVVKNRFEEIKSRGLLRKAYYYIFTGKNDQIITLDIKFDTGEVLFNQPTALNNSSAVLAEGQGSRQLYIYNNTDSNRPQISPFAEYANSNPDLFENGPLQPWNLPDSVTPTQAPDIVQAALQAPPRENNQGRKIPDIVEGGAYYGFSNTIFGHLAYQHHLAAMGKTLIQLTMTVRGDPWYLGKSPNGDILENRILGTESYSNPLAGSFLRDHTFFFLNLASPRFPDDNYDDEDQGTGYWSFGSGGGLVKSFSGIYLLTQVTNSFSGGVFTSELSGHLMVEFGVDRIADSVTPETSENTTTDATTATPAFTLPTIPTESDLVDTLANGVRRAMGIDNTTTVTTVINAASSGI